jgi:hypothetical protein
MERATTGMQKTGTWSQSLRMAHRNTFNPQGARLLLLCAAALSLGAQPTHPLPFYYDLYSFRGTGGRTSVVAAFAVPAGELQREGVERGNRYRFDVTLVLADTALRRVVRRDDSVFVVLREPLKEEHLLFTQLEVNAMPTRTTVHRVIMTDATRPGFGQMFDSTYVIRDYSGTQLMLSDIALGQPDTRGGWKRGDVALAILPTSQFPSSSFDVFYEIYNLPDGASYTTQIVVQSLDKSDARPVTLRFPDIAHARGGTVQVLRRIDTSLGRGKHRITVTVSDGSSGASASMSREFEVQSLGRGATLVPALPRRGDSQ